MSGQRQRGTDDEQQPRVWTPPPGYQPPQDPRGYRQAPPEREYHDRWYPPEHDQQRYAPPPRPQQWGPVPTPPEKKKTDPKQAAVGCLVIVVLFIVIVAIVSAANSSGTKNATGASASATSTTGATSDQVAMLAWWTNGGQADANAVQAAETAIHTATGNQDVAAMAGGCKQLLTAAQKAQADSPPVESVAQPWNSAMAHYATGASECEQAAAAGDANELQTAVGDLSAGNTEVSQATKAIDTINGKS